MLRKNINLMDGKMLSDKALVEWLGKRFAETNDKVVVAYTSHDIAVVPANNLVVSQERMFDHGTERLIRCDHASPVARCGTPYTIFVRVQISQNAVIRQPWFKDFFKAYQVAALWSSIDEAGIPLDSNFDLTDFDRASRRRMMFSCAEFVTRNLSLIQDAILYSNYNWEQAGHDFWLTRNGHGAGFWDRGMGKRGEKLTESAHEFGESNIESNMSAVEYGGSDDLFLSVIDNKPVKAEIDYSF